MPARKPKEINGKPAARASRWTVGSPGGRPYKIGYLRPPEAYQFKPGQSGNPAGRPSGKERLKRLGLATVIAEALYRRSTTRAAGRKLTRLEAVARQVRTAPADTTVATAIGRLDAADRALIARIILRLAAR